MKKFVTRVAIFLVYLSPATNWANVRGTSEEKTESGDGKIIWMSDDGSTPVSLSLIQDKPYFTVEQIARYSKAQIHWQPVSHRACLSHEIHDLCFDWKENVAFIGSSTEKLDLVYKGSELYIPQAFVESKEFETLSQTEVHWNDHDKTYHQKRIVSVEIPPVENLGDRYRLTLLLKPGTSFELLQKDKKKIWLRFLNAQTEGSQILDGDTIIHSVRVDQHRSSADLTVFPGPRATSIDVQSDTETKLYVDVFYSPKPLVKREENVKPLPVGSVAKVVPPTMLSKKANNQKVMSPVTDKNIRTIVIDPGHGGIDCGAIGLHGTMEKDINLTVSLLVGERLTKAPQTRIIYTREKDEFVSLEERALIANKSRADMFISIHCNSSLSNSSVGFETYVLAMNATDAASAATARIENSVVVLESKKGDNPGKVAALLASMATSQYFNESRKIADHICRGVKQKSSVKLISVREANFYVLRDVQMPSVLLELDYLSNQNTESKLKSSRYRRQLVNGIADGILYYEQNLRNHSKRSEWQAENSIAEKTP